MRTVVFALCLLFAASARAQEQVNADVPAAIAAIDAETRCYVHPGPEEGASRAVCVWKPRMLVRGPLPVLYMADGMDGVHIAVLDIKPAILAGTIAPMMVVASDPLADPEDRAAEYLRGFGGARRFELHEKWLIEKVLPWAERNHGASPERAHRFIGGFSNGADLALAVAGDHPELFGGALVHSPVGANAGWVLESARSQRWVVTGGTQETRGSVQRGGQLPREISQALERRGAPVRTCIGRWAHQGRIWRQLSPGSLAWLMGLGAPETAETPFERGKCVMANDLPPA